MLIVGGGWLIILPAFLFYVEDREPWLQFRPLPYVSAGVALFLIGAALALWAGYFLIHYGRGTPLPFDPPSRLVTTGPYRYIRNPQPIAMMLLVLGEVVAIESNWLWLMVLLTIVYLEGAVGPYEKKQMATQYGDEYMEYIRRVRRWIPCWRRG